MNSILKGPQRITIFWFLVKFLLLTNVKAYDNTSLIKEKLCQERKGRISGEATLTLTEDEFYKLTAKFNSARP